MVRECKRINMPKNEAKLGRDVSGDEKEMCQEMKRNKHP